MRLLIILTLVKYFNKSTFKEFVNKLYLYTYLFVLIVAAIFLLNNEFN
jgi:hypothetical protein